MDTAQLANISFKGLSTSLTMQLVLAADPRQRHRQADWMTIGERAASDNAHPGASDISSFAFFRRRFGEFLALSQYGFPFSVSCYPSPVGRFRALARRTRFTRQSGPVRAITAIAMTLTWPFGAFSTAVRISAS